MEKIYQIGVMLGSMQTQHPREIVLGLFDEALDANVNLTFFMGAQAGESDFVKEYTSEDGEGTYSYQYNSLYDYALLGKMDAFIIAYGTLFIFLSDTERDKFLAKFSKVPLVVLEMYDESTEYNYIMSDNYEGVVSLVEHLITVHGYKKILHLSGPDNNVDGELRKKAYIDTMTRFDLPIGDKMIVRGDYTKNVRDKVIELLDNNPDAEAIVCANDEMASCVYEVCRERGLAVGKDIAVTGYDDVELAQRLDPPLTTANQDGIEMGHKALLYALNAIRENEHNVHLMPAAKRIRGSCGCEYHTDSETSLIMNNYMQIRSARDFALINGTAAQAVNYVLRSGGTGEIVEQCMKTLVKVIHVLLDIRSNKYEINESQALVHGIMEELRFLREGGYIQYINVTKFLSSFREMINYEMKNSEKITNMQLLHLLEETAAAYIELMIMQEHSEKNDTLTERNWTIPADIQHLMEVASDDKLFFYYTMEMIRRQGTKNAYLLVLREPIIRKRHEASVSPKELYMAASLENGEINAFADDEQNIINTENGFSELYSDVSGRKYMANILFAEEIQFGILLSEAEFENVDSLYSLSLQISNALAYKRSVMKEAETKESLYKTLRELEDKNSILSLISSNDQLTGIYNRRGLMEKMIEACHSNVGNRAFLFFCDIDHLKEINDVFGHAEGDFAIINGAKMIQEVLESAASLTDASGFCGRLGGDEFVALVVSEDGSIPAIVRNEFIRIMSDFNKKSKKPYYVEYSIGHVDFVCSEDVLIDMLLKRADDALYEAKLNRRKSIKK